MKRFLTPALVAVIATFAGVASAQEFQPIGYAHTFSFGGGYGYASGYLANHLAGFADYNFIPAKLPQNSYFRARLELNADQIKENFSGSAAASFQYMQNIVSGLYVYPFVRVKGELHNTWANKADFAPGLGAGLEYQFTHYIGVYAQGTYEYLCAAGAGRPGFQAGVVFAIGKGKSSISKAKKRGTRCRRKV